MAFEEVQLPPSILLGSSITQKWDVDVIEYGQGARYVNIKVNQSRYRFSLRHVVERADIFADVVQFFEALGGPATGFLIDNWLDNSTAMGGVAAGTDMTLGTGDGTTTVYNISRTYTQGTSTSTKRVFKPKTGTILVAAVGSPTQSFSVVFDNGSPSSSQVDISTTAGTATFGEAPSNGAILTWGGDYFCPVALEGNEIAITGPDKWYELSGMVFVELLAP